MSYVSSVDTNHTRRQMSSTISWFCSSSLKTHVQASSKVTFNYTNVTFSHVAFECSNIFGGTYSSGWMKLIPHIAGTYDIQILVYSLGCNVEWVLTGLGQVGSPHTHTHPPSITLLNHLSEKQALKQSNLHLLQLCRVNEITQPALIPLPWLHPIHCLTFTQTQFLQEKTRMIINIDVIGIFVCIEFDDVCAYNCIW